MKSNKSRPGEPVHKFVEQNFGGESEDRKIRRKMYGYACVVNGGELTTERVEGTDRNQMVCEADGGRLDVEVYEDQETQLVTSFEGLKTFDGFIGKDGNNIEMDVGMYHRNPRMKIRGSQEEIRFK